MLQVVKVVKVRRTSTFWSGFESIFTVSQGSAQNHQAKSLLWVTGFPIPSVEATPCCAQLNMLLARDHKKVWLYSSLQLNDEGSLSGLETLVSSLLVNKC